MPSHFLNLGLGLRPLLLAAALLSLAALLYIVLLSLLVAAALARLSTVHNSAAEYSLVYYGIPFFFSRRRGAVPGSSVPQRHARFNAAFPASCYGSHGLLCAICIQSVQTGNLTRRLKCTHEFHKSCIDRWIGKGANRCPLCNLECLPPLKAS